MADSAVQRVNFENLLKVSLKFSSFSKFFKLKFRFHLHWGQKHSDGTPLRGSEHTFNNQGIVKKSQKVAHGLIL